MAFISRLCSRQAAHRTIAVQLRRYGAAAVQLDDDYECWERSYPLAVPAEEEADGNMVGRGVQWVFIGSPGVEKSTYASKLAKLLNVPHISMGSLVRQELSVHSSLSKQLSTVVSQGKLLPDNIIFSLLSKRLEHGVCLGETGFILDGFPRTRIQAQTRRPPFKRKSLEEKGGISSKLHTRKESSISGFALNKEILDHVADIDLAINLKCREDVLIKKCLGRRVCSQCGKNFNVAHIDMKGTNGGSRIHIPPVLPPSACIGKLVPSDGDSEKVVQEKLRVYSEQSKPVEDHYHKQRKLLNFEVPGGIRETWPGLLAALNLEDIETTSQQLTA